MGTLTTICLALHYCSCCSLMPPHEEPCTKPSVGFTLCLFRIIEIYIHIYTLTRTPFPLHFLIWLHPFPFLPSSLKFQLHQSEQILLPQYCVDWSVPSAPLLSITVTPWPPFHCEFSVKPQLIINPTSTIWTKTQAVIICWKSDHLAGWNHY